MTKENQDSELHIGVVNKYNYTVYDKDGVLVNLAGFSIRWCLWNKAKTAILIQKDVGAGITVLGTGQYQVQLDAVDSASMTGGYYAYDTSAKEAGANGDADVVARGVMTAQVVASKF